MPHAEELLAEDISEYYADPLGFVMYAFPWSTNSSIQQVELPEAYQKKYNSKYGPDAWAISFLEDVGREVRNRGFDGQKAVDPIQFSTASGHGIGKSALTAWLILWIMSTRPFCKGIVTANTSEQLRTKTWAELGKWWRMCVTSHWFVYNSGRGSMSLYYKERPESWRVDAQTCREENSEAFAGLHCANSTPFYIFDEASAVPDKIFEVREGGTTDGEPMTFDFGNPTRNTGRFFENCIGKFRNNYNVRSIDSRSVAITNKNRLNQWVEDYGDDSDFVKVRVKGVFPSIGIFQFMSTDAVLEAMNRQVTSNTNDPVVIGVDVARRGDDKTVIYPRIGRDAKSFDPVIVQSVDAVQIAGLVIAQVHHFRGLGKPVAGIFVDGIGYGSGVVDQLKHLGYNVFDVHAQHKCKSPDRYRYRIDEMWGDLRDAIGEGLCLPEKNSKVGQELFAELTQREYDYTLKGQINLESKSDMKERGIPSPNIADALAMTYYEKVAPIELSGGSQPKFAQSDYDVLNTDW